VRTPLVEGQIADQAVRHGVAEDEVVRDVLLARTPVKRLIDPEEVAGLVGFLCGPGTDSINGASYVLDGGWTAT
jgi:3-hydroxybutyrate dehydrogenase